MIVVNSIAKVAKLMPKVVLKARYFKHSRHWPTLSKDINKIDSLVQYVMQHGVENRNNPQWIKMADKFKVREEIDRKLGQGHLVPLLGHWENPEDIDFDKLPKSFILKTNNGCGTNVFVHDKDKADRDMIVRQMKRALAFPYPELTGQLHYAHIKPMVVAEEILSQGDGRKSLTDYKIHCVNGEPQTLYIFTDRDEVNHFDFTMMAYTSKWQEIPPGSSPDEVADNPEAPDKPEWLDEMLEMARKLSENEEYVRVDFYCVDGKIYFGEMTYMPDTFFNKCYNPYQKAMKYLLDKIREGRS